MESKDHMQSIMAYDCLEETVFGACLFFNMKSKNMRCRVMVFKKFFK